MRYAELLIGHPFSPRYRPAPPDSEREREIRRRAARDRDAGMDFADLPEEERNLWQTDRQAYWAMYRTYDTARHPERLEAPARWPEQIALIAASIPSWMLSVDGFSWRAAWMTLALTPVTALHTRASTAARRRSARRRGVTPRTAPRPVIALDPWMMMAVTSALALRRWRREGRSRRRRAQWELYLATAIVATLDERRSYNAALRRTSTAR